MKSTHHDDRTQNRPRARAAPAALALAACALLGARSASAAPTCITLTLDSGGEQDTMILQSQPDTDWDGYSSLFTGVSKGGTLGYTLIRNDVSDIPSGALITSAVISVTENNAAKLGTVRAHRILGGWDPLTATWNDFSAGYDPTVLSSQATVAASPSSTAVLSFDVTALAQSWVDGAVANDGVLLEQSPGCSYYDNVDGPSLDICYVDACDPSPCVHGACSTAADGYTCACEPGWAGTNCDTCAGAGFADCDGNAANGCETSIETDPDNCGACGLVCDAPHAVPSCTAGACGIASCDPGFADCDGDAVDGCETSIETDPDNCGGCGAVCAPFHAAGSCAAGACTIASCDPGFADCDGNAADGCETSIDHDPDNCGACGVVCDPAHGTGSCVAGKCEIVSCDPGFADCDANPANGCEAALDTDTNCGVCGHACMFSEAPASCVSGVCTIGPCDPGFGDCDHNTANGCETALDTSSNCGACGVACDTPPSSCYVAAGSCSSGACSYNPKAINTPCSGGFCDGVGNCMPCQAGLTLCGTTCVAESNDPNNCGGCGHVCNVGQVCSSGTCSGAFATSGIAVGAEFACVVLSSGGVECWGGIGTGIGELGNGSTAGSTTPVAVSGISNAKSVFAAAFSACALLSTGGVECWGDNADGQLGNGTTTNSAVPVAVTGLTNAVSVSGATEPSGGNSFACAVQSTGHVVCWGNNTYGQLGNGTTTNSSTPVQVSGLSNATAVAAGNGFACALQSTGTVVCWGDSAGGALGNGANGPNFTTPVAVSGVSGAVGIAASYEAGCAVKASGTVVCWGENNEGQLGNGTFTNSLSPVTVSGLNDATAITGSCGSVAATLCAATTTGGAVCWGNNNYGQLGNGTTTTSDVPVVVTGLTGAAHTASGGGAGTGNGSGCSLLGNGAVVCWGSNVYGQLGNGTLTSSSTIVGVVGL